MLVKLFPPYVVVVGVVAISGQGAANPARRTDGGHYFFLPCWAWFGWVTAKDSGAATVQLTTYNQVLILAGDGEQEGEGVYKVEALGRGFRNFHSFERGEKSARLCKDPRRRDYDFNSIGQSFSQLNDNNGVSRRTPFGVTTTNCNIHDGEYHFT